MDKKKKILIVEDDPDFSFQLKLQIENLGFEAITGASQKEGEKIIENLKPDLAIFDLMMENQDSGFILSYKIKKKYEDVPVIIISSVTNETGMMFGVESHEEKKWIKADLFIDKGIRQDQLQREINKLLKI